jgi:uncharacterized protein (TIGR00725 family)
MIVGIFGTWRALPGDSVYTTAREIGGSLASEGHRVLSGGYSGVMEAASRGAYDKGGTPIGVTCPELDDLLAVNRWVGERIRTTDLLDRLGTCMRMCEAALFFPGRAGTAAELAVASELREKGRLKLPLMLVGPFWTPLLEVQAGLNVQLPYPLSQEHSTSYVVVHSGEQVLRVVGSAAT